MAEEEKIANAGKAESEANEIHITDPSLFVALCPSLWPFVDAFC